MLSINSVAPHHQQARLALIPLLMVIFLDVAGVLLVLPVLTPLILEPSNTLVPSGTSLMMRDFYYGFSMALCPLFMFFSTPILGDLSDRYGRKKMLLWCLFASAASYIVAALGVIFSSLVTLLLSRVLVGLAAGTQSIATAAIIDMSTLETKTKYLAWVVLASCIGVVLGPLMGGVTSERALSTWFGYPTPFILAALLSLMNAVLLWVSFTDEAPKKMTQQIHLFKGFSLFTAAFSEARFRILSLLFCTYTLAWSLYYQAITWLFMERFHYSSAKLGLFIAYLGLISTVATLILPRLMLSFFKKDISAYLFFVCVMSLGNLGAAYSQSELAQWLWVILNAGGEVICFTLSLSLFSDLVGVERQGWIMGVTGSLAAITWTVGGLIAGPLGYLTIRAPLWVAGLLCLVSFVCMLNYKKNAVAG